MPGVVLIPGFEGLIPPGLVEFAVPEVELPVPTVPVVTLELGKVPELGSVLVAPDGLELTLPDVPVVVPGVAVEVPTPGDAVLDGIVPAEDP